MCEEIKTKSYARRKFYVVFFGQGFNSPRFHQFSQFLAENFKRLVIDVSKVRRCRVEKINWEGRDVFIGIYLSEVDDNTGVSILAVDEDDNILIDSFAIISSVVADKKSKVENVDYEKYVSLGKVFKCEGETIDTDFVANFIINLQKKYKVRICGIEYDRYKEQFLRNALLKAAEELEKDGTIIKVTIVPQTSEPMYKMLEFSKLKILKKLILLIV